MRWVRSKNIRVLPLQGRMNVVIYNSIHGNAVLATPDTVKFLALFETPRSDEFARRHGGSSNSMELLCRSCFLIPEGSDERTEIEAHLKKREAQLADGALIRHLRLFSADCDFACAYCSVTHLNHSGSEKLIDPKVRFPWPVARRAVDAFLALGSKHGHEMLHVRFFGGEPLRDWATYKKVIEYIESQPHRPEVAFYLNTNGSAISATVAKYLREHKVKTIVSLDGVAEVNDRLRTYPNGKGTYNATMKGIDSLAAAQVDIHLNVTLTSSNMLRMRETIEFAKRIGAKDVGVDDLCFIGDDRCAATFTPQQQASAILEAWHTGREIGIPVRGAWTGFRSFSDTASPLPYCAGNGEELCVNHEGKVFPCYGIPWAIGSIDSLAECFRHPVYRAVALRVLGHIPKCQGCELEGPCGGGCAADAFAATQDLSSILPIKCDMRRIVTRELLQQWAIAQEEAL